MGPSYGGDGDGDGDGEVTAKQIESPPLRSMGPSCGGDGDGEVATKHAKLSSDAGAGAGCEDRLSALPNDILILILGHLGTCAAVQTSVLSSRWRGVWALLPELNFPYALDPRQIGRALEDHKAALLRLGVLTRDAAPGSVAAWLPVAAPHLCGTLYFRNFVTEGPGQSGAFELPCLERATKVSLHLGFLGLAVPPAGVFARLTDLCLDCFRLYGPGDLGDAVSWPRCPCLQKLIVRDARELDNLAIRSDSLRQVGLINVQGLRQLNIVAPALEGLKVERCFLHNGSQPIASARITAPQLATLQWNDPYDPRSVHLGEMKHLRLLSPFFFIVYGPGFLYNQYCLSLVRRFRVIKCLMLALTYVWDINDYQYMMEDMTVLPDITILHLSVLAKGHAFGASAFHVLRMCSNIKKLTLLFVPPKVEAQNTCPPGCICGEHQNWQTEHLLLNRLKEVEITWMRGSEHEVAFVKQLFNWATSLEKMRVVLDKSVTESVAKELSQVLRSFARPGIRMEIHPYMVDVLMTVYVPED